MSTPHKHEQIINNIHHIHENITEILIEEKVNIVENIDSDSVLDLDDIFNENNRK